MLFASWLSSFTRISRLCTLRFSRLRSRKRPLPRVAVELLEPRTLLSVTAQNDVFTTVHDRPLTVSSPGVLMNDSATGTFNFTTMTYTPPGPLSATLQSGPSNGVLSFNANGSFTYTPSLGFTGTATFTYKALAGTETSVTATVTIMVTNMVPTANNDVYTTPHNFAIVAPTPGVLMNDSDSNGDPITATLLSSPSSGTLTFNSNGSFSYTPSGSFVGSVNFTYRVSDGIGNSFTATASILISNMAPYFDGSMAMATLSEGDLWDGDVLGTIAANDLNNDSLTYSSPTNLADLGITLQPVVLSDGRNAVEIVASDSVKLWKKVLDNPGTTLEIRAFDGWEQASKLLGFVGSSSQGGTGVPPPAWNAIPGYPATLPAAGKVKAIVAVRGVHSFIILLDDAGESRCWSGRPDGGNKLKVDTGLLGDYESYEPAKMSYQIIPGEFDRVATEASFTLARIAINSAAKPYDPKSNNCHCASSFLLSNFALTPPAFADSAGKIGLSLGWKKKPDGVP